MSDDQPIYKEVAPNCSLCGKLCEPWHKPPTGYGHNPEPLGRYGERCCNECNETKVLPERLRRMGIALN